MGSRAVAVLARDEAAAERGSASPTAAPARSTPAPAGRSSTTRRDDRPGRAGCGRPRRRSSTSWSTDWLLLDAELLPWSAKALGADPRAVRRVGAAARRALPAARRGARAAAAGAGPRRRPTCRAATARAAGQRARRSATRTGATAGRPTGWTACAWRRSTCWPPRAGRRRRRDHAWHLDQLAAARRRRAAHPDPAPGRRPRLAPSSAADGRSWWVELTAAGGEGMVVKPAAPGRPSGAGAARAQGAAAGSTCGSSTAPTTPTRLDLLRQRGLGRKRDAGPARARPRPGRARPRSPTASRCGGSTSRCSRSSPGVGAGRPAALTRPWETSTPSTSTAPPASSAAPGVSPRHQPRAHDPDRWHQQHPAAPPGLEG